MKPKYNKLFLIISFVFVLSFLIFIYFNENREIFWSFINLNEWIAPLVTMIAIIGFIYFILFILNILNSKNEYDVDKIENNSKVELSEDNFFSDYYDTSEIIEINYSGISRYGIKDNNGNWIIQPMFDSVRNGYDEWGYCIVQLNGKWGLIKGNFSWILDPIYDDLDSDWSIYSPDIFAKLNGKWGLIQTSDDLGNWKIKPNFDSITSFKIDNYKCSLNGKYGVIDEDENWIIKPEFQEITNYNDQELIAAKLNDKWGFINIKGDWLIEPKYEAIRNSEDLWNFIIKHKGFGNNDYCIVKYQDKWGFIDRNDKWIVEPIFYFLQNEFNEKGYCLGNFNNEIVGVDKLGKIYKNPNQDFDSQFLIEDKNDFDLIDSKTDSDSNESQSDNNDNQKSITSNYNIDDLNNLIGLKSVKSEIITLHNFINIQKKRGLHGLRTSPISHHCVFTGSPGTGKTTVARIIASIYKEIGLLNKGHLVETDRSGLVAEYLGQTAAKVNRVFDSALDGILFIDEAYSLVGENQDDFGKEAVSTLIKRMEDDRNRIIVILAGYKDEMEKFINSNPGLQSRFNRYIHFDDYNPGELIEIFKKYCNDEEYQLSIDAENSLHQFFIKEYNNKNKNFGNGRFVRNIFEKVINIQANRIINLDLYSKNDFKIIDNFDILNLDSGV
jgi:AAA+ superfamily predicted ATPase